MAHLGKQQILLDSVDLTGQQPVYSQKVVEKTIEIHNLDGDDVKMQSPTDAPTSSFSSIVDRRLRYYFLIFNYILFIYTVTAECQ